MTHSVMTKLFKPMALSLALGVSVVAMAANPVVAQAPAATQKQENFDSIKGGLFEVQQDAQTGKVLFKLPKANADGVNMQLIYASYLSAGLGSNPIGLDRAQPAGSKLINFRQFGNKIVIEEENVNFRASADNEAEKRSVRNSFARAWLWSGKVHKTLSDGSVLVDVTSFLTRDSHGIANRLKGARQGNARLDAGRSLVNTKNTLSFPKNIELDATLTFDVSGPGREVRGVSADAENVTLMTHHSFIALPEAGFEVRPAKPWSAGNNDSYQDYSAPLGENMIIKMANRHRLEKVDPTKARDRVKKPIVYYVDNGAPEPIRQALIDGASWWATAFDKAGFIDAFQVKVLPEDAHPQDIRYNMINWVHRQTRGWSYGGSVSDPRTGEILKGNVLLGSLRVRQDIKIFEGLVGAEKTGSGGKDDPVQIALTRIRQLSAHEVGHTLGFAHNMGASTQDRASVMDYPAPQVDIVDGKIDLSNAYGVGMGKWDDFTVDYLYHQFAPGVDPVKGTDEILKKAAASGLRFVADQHSRAAGTGHIYGGLWDTGNEPIESLRHTMKVREIALKNFGMNNIKDGQPVADLADVLVPVYLFHRFQIQAAAKSLGGMDFTYGTKGDGQGPATIASPERQRDALSALVDTLDPAIYDLSDDQLALLTPRNGGWGEIQITNEMFKNSINPAFDLYGAVEVASGLTLNELLHPGRAGRMVLFHSQNDKNPDFTEVLDAISAKVFDAPRGETGRLAEIRRVIQSRYLNQLVNLAGQGMSAGQSGAAAVGMDYGAGRGAANHGVALRAESQLRKLMKDLSRNRSGDEVQLAHERSLADMIKRFLERDAVAVAAVTGGPVTPPGSPIGADTGFEFSRQGEGCWHCDSSRLMRGDSHNE